METQRRHCGIHQAGRHAVYDCGKSSKTHAESDRNQGRQREGETRRPGETSARRHRSLQQVAAIEPRAEYDQGESPHRSSNRRKVAEGECDDSSDHQRSTEHEHQRPSQTEALPAPFRQTSGTLGQRIAHGPQVTVREL